jgi:hypothetical protein
MLGLAPAKTVGMAVKDISIPNEVKDAIMNIQFKGAETNEAPVECGAGTLAVSVSFMRSVSGETAGILCTFRKEGSDIGQNIK